MCHFMIVVAIDVVPGSQAQCFFIRQSTIHECQAFCVYLVVYMMKLWIDMKTIIEYIDNLT